MTEEYPMNKFQKYYLRQKHFQSWGLGIWALVISLLITSLSAARQLPPLQLKHGDSTVDEVAERRSS